MKTKKRTVKHELILIRPFFIHVPALLHYNDIYSFSVFFVVVIEYPIQLRNASHYWSKIVCNAVSCWLLNEVYYSQLYVKAIELPHNVRKQMIIFSYKPCLCLPFCLFLSLSRLVDLALKAIMRAMWFSGGFHWVRVKGRPALPSEAPILTMAPHSSYFDAIPVTMTMASIVMKAESKDIPVWGSKFLKILIDKYLNFLVCLVHLKAFASDKLRCVLCLTNWDLSQHLDIVALFLFSWD